MKQILLLILLTASNDVLAQERIDTLYYNRSGSVVPSPAFAEYYRIALYPADSAGSKMFRDFYISGELRTEGHFQTIDTLDDRRTVFDGKIVSYFKNGRISEKSYYSGGLLEGEYLQYDENGMLKTRASYARGELSGTYETYGEDGSYLKMEYQAGKPIHDYYLLADGEGHFIQGPYCGRYDDMGITGHNGTIGRLPGRCALGSLFQKRIDNRADGCHCPGLR